MQTLSDTIRAKADGLTPSEQRLVTSLLTDPREAALASVVDVARNAGVHAATVSRLARKLGFDGYPAFRSALQREFLPARQATATRFKRTLDATGQDSILGRLIAQEIAALSGVTDHISDDAITTAARLTAGARRIFVFARGNAEALAMVAARRFLRFGCDVRLLTGDARALAEGVLGMGSNDVVLAYALRRAPRHYAALVNHARTVGAKVVVISDTLGPMLIPAPDYLLSAPRSADGDEFQTLTVPMAITNALVLAVGQQEETKVLISLETLGTLISEFE